MTANITTSRIKQARATAARLFELYGDEYLPLFERLDEEVRMREQTHSVRDRALMIARNAAEQTLSV